MAEGDGGGRVVSPLGEPRGNGVIDDEVRGVVKTLTSKPARDPVTKRFIAGNVGAGKSLAHSGQLWEALGPAKRELVQQVTVDRGLDGDSAVTLAGLADAWAEATLLRRSMFIRMADLGGPITTKGKARALYTAYLGALDREIRLAQVLGLDRHSKRVDLARAMSGLD